MALAMGTTVGRDIGDPVHHEHRRGGKLCVAGAEKLTAGAFQQIFLVETRGVVGHPAALLLLCYNTGPV